MGGALVRRSEMFRLINRHASLINILINSVLAVLISLSYYFGSEHTALVNIKQQIDHLEVQMNRLEALHLVK